MEHGGARYFNTAGGRICAECYGARGGRPVFYLHGQFSSRKEAQYFHYAAAELGICLIALDRPGFGGSPHVAGRRVKDWPPVMLEIADQLGIAKFGIVAVSAGAKFALATALAAPDRVTGVALASTFGPLNGAAMPANALPRVRATLWLYRRAPWIGRVISSISAFVMTHGTRGFIRAFQYLAPATEREVLLRPEVLAIATEILNCSAVQGPAGLELEFRLIVEPWNLDLGQIRVPVALFHGIQDRVAPLGMATALAQQIPGARLKTFNGAGHVSLLVKHAADVLAAL